MLVSVSVERRRTLAFHFECNVEEQCSAGLYFCILQPNICLEVQPVLVPVAFQSFVLGLAEFQQPLKANTDVTSSVEFSRYCIRIRTRGGISGQI